LHQPLRMRAALVPLVLLACAPAFDAPPASGRAAVLRVATWNVHDLFDAEDRTLPPGELDTVPAPAEVDLKLDRVAAVLLRLDADVILLQEVETLALVEQLAARTGYPEARLVEGADPRGIDVAALSRVPVRAYVSHRDERDVGGGPLWPRDCVELHLDAGAGRWAAVVGTHLSSALSDDGTRRARQADRLREIADALLAAGAARVIAGGDLNDAATSPALAPLLGDGAWVDASALLLPDQAWTWSRDGDRAALDHLAVPRDAWPAVLRAEVLAGPDVAAASDHRPVAIELLLE
jgi:endonuclease/exonuclease/phosphatase family metal-dependent hydrolase